MKASTYVIIALISLALAFAISHADLFSPADYDFSSDLPTDNIEHEATEYTTYYEQLTDFEKNLYDALAKTVSRGRKSVSIDNVNVADFKASILKVCEALQYDHPEYFWFSVGCSYSYPKNEAVGEITIEPKYYDYVSSLFEFQDKKRALLNAAEQVASLAESHSADDFERIKFVHDYLVENAVYDHKALEEYEKASKSPSCDYIFSAYGCLVNGKTVCAGYAKAFQLIMHQLGYDCTYVVGDAGEAHAWNCVYLDGDGYFIDVTWDDHDYEKEIPVYNYFLITGNDLSKTHTIDDTFQVPVCTASEYNYFVKKGFYLEKYSYDAVKDILLEQKDNDGAHIKFGSRLALETAKNELIKKRKINQIFSKNEKFYYTYNEKHYTLTILLDY